VRQNAKLAKWNLHMAVINILTEAVKQTTGHPP
jgi:hypothetical protein